MVHLTILYIIFAPRLCHPNVLFLWMLLFRRLNVLLDTIIYYLEDVTIYIHCLDMYMYIFTNICYYCASRTTGSAEFRTISRSEFEVDPRAVAKPRRRACGGCGGRALLGGV